MELLVNLIRGMECPRQPVLPPCQIGSTANEMAGSNVILRPHGRKQNQRLMNHWQSTSISGKHESENHEGQVHATLRVLASPSRCASTSSTCITSAYLWCRSNRLILWLSMARSKVHSSTSVLWKP